MLISIIPPHPKLLSPQCSINDGAEFKAVADAMKVIGFKQEEIQTVYKIVAAILHLVSSLPMVSIPEPIPGLFPVLPAALILLLQEPLEALVAGEVCPVHSSSGEGKSLLEQGTAVMITCIPACSRSQTRQTTKYWELLNVLKKELLGFGSEGIGSFSSFVA